MATSGVTSFNVTRNDIINMALEDCGAYAPDFQNPTPGQISRASMRLNAMIKAWQAAGVGLWLNQLCTLPLQANTTSYLLGPSGSPCSANMGDTLISTNALAGAYVITVDSVVGISSGMNIGVEQAGAGLIQWTTVNGAPVGNDVLLTAALTGAVTVGSVVYFYSALISRPIGVVEVRSADKYGDEMPLYVSSREEYFSLPLKSSTGRTTQCYFDPQTGNAVLYVWPVSIVMSDRILFTARTPIQDFVNIDDTPDFPVEWIDALHFNLALRLSPLYKVPQADYAMIKENAVVTLRDANDFDREQTSVYLTFATGPGRR
jgi:hypothetical protein